jgi:hypothetical protein
MMLKASLLAAALLAASPALAQQAGESPVPQPSPPAASSESAEVSGAPNDAKVNQLIVYGDDACPASTEDEIIVCARKPEEERYRIPENLRELGNRQSESWANRASELSYVGRTGTDSCSTTGPGGFTGCLSQIINTAQAERETRDEVNWNRLIEQARQERLGRIDEESEAVERERSEPK